MAAMGFLLIGGGYGATAQATVHNPNCTALSPYECGWWWKKHPPKQKAKPVTPDKPTSPPDKSKQSVEIDCTDPDQWRAPCGFVNPGNDFAFQSRQRDALMKRMVMNPNSPAAVRGFQEYNKWVFDRAITIGRMWRWNMVQDPSLDPMQATPVSQFGLQLLKQEDTKRRISIYNLLKQEGAFLIYFSRSDCDYCHAMTPVINRLAKKTGLEVYNASLDHQCMRGFEGEHCMTAPTTIAAARKLDVASVPTLFIFMPDDNQWVRIASGVASSEVIQSRIRLFVAAIKAANENAIMNADESGTGRPSVDFRQADQIKAMTRYGLGDGVPPEDDTQ